MINRPGPWTFGDLAELTGQVDDVSSLIPGREGTGVHLAAILEAAGLMPGAKFITLEAEEGSFAASAPLEPLLDGILLYALGGKALPAEKGGPFRFLLPDTVSCGVEGIDNCVNVKFIERIIVGATKGRDTRPKSRDEHEALHEKPGHERSK